MPWWNGTLGNRLRFVRRRQRPWRTWCTALKRCSTIGLFVWYIERTLGLNRTLERVQRYSATFSPRGTLNTCSFTPTAFDISDIYRVGVVVDIYVFNV